MNSLASARRFVGLALKRGAVARKNWRPMVRRNHPLRSTPGAVPMNRAGFALNPKKAPVGARRMSQRVLEIRYKHDDDGKLYRHPFGVGVCMAVLPNGNIVLYHKDGKPLAREF